MNASHKPVALEEIRTQFARMLLGFQYQDGASKHFNEVVGRVIMEHMTWQHYEQIDTFVGLASQTRAGRREAILAWLVSNPVFTQYFAIEAAKYLYHEVKEIP